MMMDRRRFLSFTAAGAASLALPRAAFAQDGAKPFSLPPLGYPYEALEPHIDAQTMNIHHTRHHQAYVNNANAAVARWPDLAKMKIEDVLRDLSKAPESVRTTIRNNVGGHWNHTFFWDLMTPGGAKEPQGELKAAIDKSFGDVDKMKERMNQAATGRFGSGWAWLVLDKDGKLDVISTANQDTPLELGVRSTILGVDVWEHAYYLKYQNRRGDYLGAWWNTVNWDKAAANFVKKG
jgi:superoxide dismutase, Fe-Mn family